MAAEARGRSARGGACGSTGLREEGRRGTGEGGRNNYAWGGPRDAKDMGRGTTAKKRMTMEAGRRHRGHDAQVRSVGDRGVHRRSHHREREANSKEWSV